MTLISPFLFNLVLEGVLPHVEKMDSGYEFSNGTKVKILAYVKLPKRTVSSFWYCGIKMGKMGKYRSLMTPSHLKVTLNPSGRPDRRSE